MRGLRVGAAAAAVGFLLLFFAWPLAAIVGRGFSPRGFVNVFAEPRLRSILWFTCWQAVASTVLTVAIALPGAWALGRYRFRGRALVWVAVTIPFVLPSVVVAAAFVALLGRGGPLGGLGLVPGVTAIVAAHVFFNYAVIVRAVGAAMAAADPSLEQAARTLGASRWRTFREVSLPLVGPAVAAAASIVFLFTFTSFGVILVLGGARRATLEVEIWRQTAFFLDLRAAAALAVVQLVCVVACLVLFGRFQRRVPAQRATATAGRRARTAGERAFVGANLAVMAVLLGAPIAVLVHRSVDTGAGLGLAHYRGLWSAQRGTNLFIAPWEAVRNSVVLAALSAVLAVVIGGTVAAALAGRRSRARSALDLLAMLPLGTSAVTIGFGFLLAFDTPPLDLRSSRLLLPVAHALVGIPFVVRIVAPALRGIDPSLREAAAVLGAGGWRTRLEVDLPLVSRALAVATGFAFTVSLGEFGATVFLARPDLPTMPLAIFRFLGRPGALNLGQAMAMSTLLLAVTALAVAGVERARAGAAGPF